MVRKRSQTLRKKCFERDDFCCRKCGVEDKTSRILEAHHIKPLYANGEDNLDNLITLCLDCHHFAPDKEEEFQKYMEEEMTGTFTTLMKCWEKVRKEHPELFEELEKEYSNDKTQEKRI
jgi:rubrerythrin